MTTIVSVRRGNQVALAGDGQVSLGNTVMKGNASKVRRLYRGKVLAGFAGIAIGSGGNFAQASARALLENTELSAREITEKSLSIAGDICVFTNHHVTLEELSIDGR